jgi:hypothetical protein
MTDHPRSLADRLLATTGSPAIGNVAAQGIQPLGGAILTRQPDGDTERHDAAIAGNFLGCVHEQRRDAEPPECRGRRARLRERSMPRVVAVGARRSVSVRGPPTGRRARPPGAASAQAGLSVTFDAVSRGSLDRNAAYTVAAHLA